MRKSNLPRAGEIIVVVGEGVTSATYGGKPMKKIGKGAFMAKMKRKKKSKRS